jgi:DmsE family decaheme c-type cytochrome
VRSVTHSNHRTRQRGLTLLSLGLMSLVFASCKSSHNPTCRSEDPPAHRAETNIDPGWPRANNAFRQVSYQEVRGTVPVLAGAEMVNDDDICMQCHEAYVKTFHESNVHRVQNCEACHGPASRHVETRGKEPGLIFSFKKGVDPVARAEACLKCHEQNQCTPGAQWRTSKHANCGVTCVDCHRGHYNVPAGTPPTSLQTASFSPPPTGQQTASFSPPPGTGYPRSATLVSYNAAEPPKPSLPSLKGTSHALGAVAPDLCLKCHCDMRDLLRVAGPHQIGGPNGFNCTTCHDPHGKIVESTRKDLCLSCHKGAPTMAWHASTHERMGVSCTDCHNPHPHSNVKQVVNINHYGVEQPKRLAMSVQEPEACYKCHQKTFALNHLPSHHPIMEGKMVCSDCHDPHGQLEKNLKADTINQLCYKCHAEKTGPFAYPHPPVNENCAICHEPHGTVANNLLRQPATFLCLRCHTGHRDLDHGGVNYNNGQGSVGVRVNPDRNANTRAALFTNCTNCHTQIHGSDVPAPANPNSGIMNR